MRVVGGGSATGVATAEAAAIMRAQFDADFAISVRIEGESEG
jgi:hypothetical protein